MGTMRWTTAAAGMLAALMLTACTAPSPSLQEKPVTLASGLDAPWSVALVGDSALISQRDDGKVLERTASGELRTAGTDGRLWLLTSNTDGRGDSREGDDRLVQPAFREG
ncbi:hypothetical protein [Microbacterium sp.]|uniref:hypothetical protein n=1 Tax=Microbacterium sp. TaxID=51671 RepID=UPI003A8D4708